MNQNRSWSSHSLFLLASIGSTVGLSNIWKFTYLVGENGGGAFVLIYLASLLFLGIPVLAAEMLLGKLGGQSMVGSLIRLGNQEGFSTRWKAFGWISNLSVFLILSFYCVIAGLSVDYTVNAISGNLNIEDAEAGVGYYNDIIADPLRLIFYQAIFVFFTSWIVARGVRKGLEGAIKWMMPAFFVILIALFCYSAFTANFSEAVSFMFQADFSKLEPDVVLVAFGQAFFSLGIGVGVMLTYGAYMPKKSSVAKSAATIAFSDGLIAIISGLAIFPIVFKFNLSPAEGPGLIFMTLPIAFNQMAGGVLIGTLFFILLSFAALSSSISLLESVIARIEESTRWSRARIVWISGFLLWLFGLLTVFSFNIWQDFTPLSMFKVFKGKTIFGLIDYFASNLVMPIGGILMAIIAGWMVRTERTKKQIGLKSKTMYSIWLFLVRYVAPTVVGVIFVFNL